MTGTGVKSAEKCDIINERPLICDVTVMFCLNNGVVELAAKVGASF